eukprot:1156352-Pelagomonas_calceolata.AAC.11
MITCSPDNPKKSAGQFASNIKSMLLRLRKVELLISMRAVPYAHVFFQYLSSTEGEGKSGGLKQAITVGWLLEEWD